jgi:hypothetical protein
MKKPVTMFSMFLVLFGFTVLPAVALEPPVVTLERIDVASIQPFFVKPRIGYKDEKDPGTEMKEGYSSTLNLAFIFDIKNPNKEAVMLDEFRFTANFEGFDVNTVFAYEDSWIPGGKTNQLRVVVTNEAFPMLLSLMVGAEHAERIKEMKTSAGALVKKWFETVSDFAFPIGVTNGTALFEDETGKELRSSFSAAWVKREQKKEEGAEEK